MHVMDDALAASTPAGASSQTRQRRGGAPNFAAADRKTAGCGFPYSSSSAECTSSKLSRRPKCAERGVNEAVLRRRRHRQGEAAGAAQIDGVARSRLEHALGHDELNDPVDDRHRHLVRRRRGSGPGVQAVPVRGDLAHEHPLGGAAALDGEGDAQTTEDLDLGLVPEDLGIDKEPVHVEDGRGEPGGCQAVSCASMSPTIVASSGSTWGRYRATTLPTGDTRNFSKFHVMSPAVPSASFVSVSSA